MMPAMSQNATYSVLLQSTNSIVREYGSNVYIVYNINATAGSVNYVDLGSGIAVSAQVPAIDINDFEIYNGSVYFCGSAYGTPIAGMFDINSVFFGGGDIKYILFTSALVCNHYTSTTEYDQVLSLRKIEVLPPISGTSTHLLMVGDASCTKLPGWINRCLVDLYFDGTNWVSAVSQAHDGIVYYDDLTITNNYVVVVGHKHGAEGEYVFRYPKPTITFPNIFARAGMGLNPFVYPYLFAGGVYAYDLETDQELLIEHLPGDRFATLCHGFYNDSYGRHEGTVLNLYNPTPAVVSRYMVSDYSSNYPCLKYSKKANSLYLLPGVGSTCPDSYIEYKLNNTYLAVTSTRRHSDVSSMSIVFTSLDATPTSLSGNVGQSILSGQIGGSLYLWRHLYNVSNRCSNSDEILLISLVPDYGSDYYRTEYSSETQTASNYQPSITILPADAICTK